MAQISQMDQSETATNDAVNVPRAPFGGEVGVEPDEYDQVAEKLFSRDSPFKVILFTSVSAREGVSHLVRALSDKLSRRGVRFVAVDGSLSRILFSNMSATRGDRERRLWVGAVPGDDHNSGPAVVERLRANYDFILVDCGALESSLDVPKLSAHADGVVLVVEAGRTGKDQIAKAVEAIGEMGGKIIGLVLNRYRDPLPNWLRKLFFRGQAKA